MVSNWLRIIVDAVIWMGARFAKPPSRSRAIIAGASGKRWPLQESDRNIERQD